MVKYRTIRVFPVVMGRYAGGFAHIPSPVLAPQSTTQSVESGAPVT